MVAEPATLLPGPLPVNTTHVLQCPVSALPFLQELRSRPATNDDEPFKKLSQLKLSDNEPESASDSETRSKGAADAGNKAEPERGLTENLAPTFVSAGNACLDFLFHVLPDTARDDVHRRLEAAWAEDPAKALRLVMQLRAVRGSGKSDRASFFHCMTWLYAKHPRTLLQNLWLVPEFGCFKDLLEIVRLALEEEGVEKVSGSAVDAPKATDDAADSEEGDSAVVKSGKAKAMRMRKKANSAEEEEEAVKKSREERVAENRRQMAEESARAAVARKEAHARRAAAVARAYETSEPLRALHNAVGAVFAAALQADLATLRAFEEIRRGKREGGGAVAEKEKKTEGEVEVEGEKAGGAENAENAGGDAGNAGNDGKGKKKRKWMGRLAPKLSLAAKWAPSPGQSYEHSTLLATSIALHLFPPSSAAAAAGPGATAAAEGAADGAAAAAEVGGSGGYARVAKERLRREVLVPLRKVLEVPEVHMSSKEWSHVAYGRVPSVCMNNNRKRFLEHDGERFKEYLADVKSGKAKIAAGALLPHEIVRSAMGASEDDGDTVGELQWKAIVADISSKGSLGSSMAVCDVSGSMDGTPMEVAIALSLLVCEVSSEPWKDHLVTFSATPQIHHVQGETLAERVRNTQGMAWGYNTDFQAVFDLLLSRAQEFQVDPADMVQRLYVFSDMQFDEARAARESDWETDHEAIVRKYTEAGYPVPEIVYWNLRDSKVSSTPAGANEKGVALVSGFSKGMLLALLGGEEITPTLVLNEAISGKLFELLQVVD